MLTENIITENKDIFDFYFAAILYTLITSPIIRWLGAEALESKLNDMNSLCYTHIV